MFCLGNVTPSDEEISLLHFDGVLVLPIHSGNEKAGGLPLD